MKKQGRNIRRKTLIRKYIDNISFTHLATFATLLFAVSVIPLLALGKYNVMCADDYSNGIAIHDVWLETGSFWKVIQCAVEGTRNLYFVWQGTYASCFLMHLCPMNFNYKLGFVVPTIMISMFSTAVYLIGRQIFVRWLGAGKREYSYIGFMLLFLFWQVMAAPFDGLYWYNGSTHYILMQAFGFFMIALLSGIIWTDHTKSMVAWSIMASILGAVVGGGNLVTGLQAEIIISLLLAYAFIIDRKKLFYTLIPWLCLTVGFMINALAPGNAARGELLEGYGAFKAIAFSFYYAAIYIVKWTSPLVVLVWTALLWTMWEIGRNSQKEFQHPFLVTASVFCLVSSMYTPTLYAMGDADLIRVHNIIQMTYYIGLFSVTTYWCGWFTHRDFYIQKCREQEMKRHRRNSFGKIVTGIALLAVIVVWTCTADKNTYTGISAMRSIVKGEAQTFYEEELIRREMYLDDSMPDIVVEVHTARPFLFEDRDLSWDADYWINQSVTHYFHKNRIVRRVE